METEENKKKQIEDLSLENEIKQLKAELIELKKELAYCQKVVAKRDERASDYLIEIEAIKRDIDFVNEEIAMLTEVLEEEIWESEMGENIEEILSEELPTTTEQKTEKEIEEIKKVELVNKKNKK